MAEVLSSSKHATVVKADLWGASDKIWKKDLSKNCMKLVWQSSICVAQFFNGRYSRSLPIDFKPLHVYHMDPTIAHLLFLPTQET